MAKTSIEWCDFSVNPIRARNKETGKVGHYCEKISPGCANCYASTLQPRRGTGLEFVVSNRDKIEVFLDESKLQEVLRRRKPTRWFWEDCSDLFGDWVKEEWLDKCFATMALTPQHTHMVLTKRPERMRQYLDADHDYLGVAGELVSGLLTDAQIEAGWIWEICRDGDGFKSSELEYHGPLPLLNVWLGVSVESQQYADERIPILLETPARVRFLSCEPLLGPLDLSCWVFDRDDAVRANMRTPAALNWDQADSVTAHPVDWVIAGGESGPHARPCNLEWIRSLVLQCQGTDVACFVKQLGSNPQCGHSDGLNQGLISRVLGSDAHCMRCGFRYPRHPKGGDPAEWPEDLRVRQFPEAP